VGERTPLTAVINAPRELERAVLERHADTVRNLAWLEAYEVKEGAERPAGSAVAVSGALEAFVRLGDGVDLEGLKDALQRRVEKVRGGLGAIEKKLANEAFLERADPDVVAGERERKREMDLELELLQRNLAGF
jgi:valyl-tRNA synthetase